MTSALSTSPLAADLLAGPLRHGLTLRHGYIHFGDTMLVVTEPGAWRMPNGIESEFVVPPGERATIGNGALRIGRATLATGRIWNPRPRRLFMPCLAAPAGLPLARLAGLGPGLTPLGDDILLGYVAGRVLYGHDPSEMAERLAARTTTLSATLLRLAARGHLPEPAHALVENGDIGPLLDFGATSGKGIALGLAFAGQEEWDEAAARSLARAGNAVRRPRKASDREEMALV